MENPLSKDELIKKIENKEDVSNVDTSSITDMNKLFAGYWNRPSMFNQPLNDWDVSNVETMEEMFKETASFNQPLNDWDVSNVEDMGWMFCYAEKFNQSLNEWDVSKVKNMSSMFQHATSFNQPLNDWDVSKVKNMNNMFCNAISFNQSLSDWKLNSKCRNFGLLDGCYLWHLFNTEEDMPVKNNKRLKLDNKVKRKWKIL